MSRILRHVGNKDFKRTRQRQVDEQRELAAKKLKEWQEAEAERKQIEEIARPLKSDWRRDLENLNETMTSSGMGMINYSAMGDVDLGTAYPNFTLSGAGVAGFNSVTRNMQGDRSSFDTIVVKVNSNSSDWEIVHGDNFTVYGSGGVGSKTVLVPSISSIYYTAKNDGSISFETTYQRRAPVNVFVPLDDPLALAFIRGGLAGSEERRQQLKDQLEAGAAWMYMNGLDPSKTSPGDIELAVERDNPSQINWPRNYFPGKKAPPGPGARPSGKPIGPELPTA